MFHPFEEFIKDHTRYTETTHEIFLLHVQEQFWKPKVRLFEQKPASERFQADYSFPLLEGFEFPLLQPSTCHIYS